MTEVESLQFCDLSSSLDHKLSFLIQLSDDEGYAGFLSDYLGQRLALEHVFFDRYVEASDWDELKLKAEIWRIQKLRARAKLMQSELQTSRRQSSRRGRRR